MIWLILWLILTPCFSATIDTSSAPASPPSTNRVVVFKIMRNINNALAAAKDPAPPTPPEAPRNPQSSVQTLNTESVVLQNIPQNQPILPVPPPPVSIPAPTPTPNPVVSESKK